MSEVTRILSQINDGDPSAAAALLPLVYEELRQLAAAKMAHEKPGQTLQATALVHEAYLRLVDVEQARHWDSRGHFFAAAAEAMRRILVENARRKPRQASTPMDIDFAKARDIFLGAVEKTDAKDRQAFLDDACGGDADLRRHVDLLEAHQQ
jgi:RNA polymerase sigma factor (TIGR02999 family)